MPENYMQHPITSQTHHK